MDEDIKDLKRLVEENAEALEQIKMEVEKIRTHMRIRTIVTILWIIAVLAPAILAIIYLPSFIGDYLASFNALF